MDLLMTAGALWGVAAVAVTAAIAHGSKADAPFQIERPTLTLLQSRP